LKRGRIITVIVTIGVTAAALWAYASQAKHKPRASAVVPIEDGKTIDFSDGTPVVKDSPADRAALDATVKEMDEAAKSVTFSATPPTKK
jgi:hypothetical protein